MIEEDWILDERSLRTYFDARRGGSASTGTPTTGRSVDPLAQRLTFGIDNTYSQGQQRHLTYCVSESSFESQTGDRQEHFSYARIVDEMKQAAVAWQSAVNVRFIHKSDFDDTCSSSDVANGDVGFRVLPHQYAPFPPTVSFSARAFLPFDYGDDAKAIIYIDFEYIDEQQGDYATARSNVSSVGVLRHELGHVLGFPHEHGWQSSNGCYEGLGDDSDEEGARPLTDYDSGSVMHYPECAGDTSTDWSLSPRDQAGAMSVFGMSPALLTGVI